MKILFLSHHFYPFIGGIEVNSEVLATEFSRAGHDVRLMTWTEEKGEKTFPFVVIRKPTKRQIVAEHRKADLVFENNPSLQLSWPQLFSQKPHVVAVRTWIARTDGGMGWQDRLKLLWLRRADAVIAISEAVRQRSLSSATVIGNPYRSSLFRVLPERNPHNNFVFLGRLVSDKGADLAIEAFAQLLAGQSVADHESLSLTIIGDGPERANLQQLCESKGIANKVYFTGALRGEALVAELNQHLFFLVPSRWEEPFGNVALEGMACGCIPIVSEGGGLTDAVGKAGLLFERGNATDLAQKMALVMNDVSLQEELLRQAGAHLRQHLPDVVGKRYLNVIEQAVHKSKLSA